MGVLLVSWASGCASARAVHLAQIRPLPPTLASVQALSVGERTTRYQLARLTWDGAWVYAGPDRLHLAELVAYLRHAGAEDLAEAAPAALPAYRTWISEQQGHLPYQYGYDLVTQPAQVLGVAGPPAPILPPAVMPPGQKQGRRHGLRRPSRADSMSDGGNLGRIFGNSGGGGGGGGGDGKALAVIAGAAAASVAAVTAYVATDSLVRGIGSDLDPKPCLEDVLEAYNQRAAAALGLDARDEALVTSMPRSLALSGRDRGRASRLARIGMGAGLVLMTVGSVAAWTAPAVGLSPPSWAWPCFYSGLGALATSMTFGYTVAW
jgi:hypothetical protein